MTISNLFNAVNEINNTHEDIMMEFDRDEDNDTTLSIIFPMENNDTFHDRLPDVQEDILSRVNVVFTKYDLGPIENWQLRFQNGDDPMYDSDHSFLEYYLPTEYQDEFTSYG